MTTTDSKGTEFYFNHLIDHTQPFIASNRKVIWKKGGSSFYVSAQRVLQVNREFHCIIMLASSTRRNGPEFLEIQSREGNARATPSIASRLLFANLFLERRTCFS